MTSSRPRYLDLPKASRGGRSAWGMFGATDSVGLLNLHSRQSVLDAVGLVRKGAVFSLNAPLDLIDPPMFDRGAVQHRPVLRPQAVSMDDSYDSFYPQASSQWDALCHVAYEGNAFYNGATIDDIAGGRNTIDHWARRGIAGRGVLLDVWRQGREPGQPYDPGTSHCLTVDALESARERAGVQFRPGDIVVLHTGYLAWYTRQDAAKRAAIAPRSGLASVGVEHTEAMAEYIWNSGCSALVSDCPSLEVWPPDFSEEAAPFGFLHRILIGQFGLAIGELWRLDELAEDCAADGAYEFLVTSAPLNMPGGVGSPANALAIK